VSMQRVQCELDDTIQSPGLFEQMRRARHNGDFRRPGQAGRRTLVQSQHLDVPATDDEQCWRTDSFERLPRQVRSVTN